jgi:hypothetical protein
VLRRIFVPKRDEVTGEWRVLLSSVLLTRYYLGDEVKKQTYAEHVARMVERRGAKRALVGKPEERRPLGRPRRRWKYNFKIDLREVGLGA